MLRIAQACMVCTHNQTTFHKIITQAAVAASQYSCRARDRPFLIFIPIQYSYLQINCVEFQWHGLRTQGGVLQHFRRQRVWGVISMTFAGWCFHSVGWRFNYGFVVYFVFQSGGKLDWKSSLSNEDTKHVRRMDTCASGHALNRSPGRLEI